MNTIQEWDKEHESQEYKQVSLCMAGKPLKSFSPVSGQSGPRNPELRAVPSASRVPPSIAVADGKVNLYLSPPLHPVLTLETGTRHFNSLYFTSLLSIKTRKKEEEKSHDDKTYPPTTTQGGASLV